MDKPLVSLVRYDKALEPVRRAIELCGGLQRIPAHAKVFIKPNIVFWTRAVDFPKWGVVTTSRLVNDVVTLLIEQGVSDITIGEGMVVSDLRDSETPAHAFESLGYAKLRERYGVKVIDTFQRPFQEVDLGEGVKLNFNQDILASDFVIDLPVMKTHAQTVVSLGIKNLKGMIDVASRKRCHNADLDKDLNFFVARLADPMPPLLTLIDGTFTSEYGPAFDGLIHRRDLLVASWDVLAADIVGSNLLGHDPAGVPHLVHAAHNRGRSLALDSVEVKGEAVADHAKYHAWSFPYTEDGCLPVPMAKRGMAGIAYYKYDNSLCTYCSGINGAVLSAIAMSWQGEPWDEVEVLTGKRMQPRPRANKTILLGKCMYQAHKDNPSIKEMIAVKGCPPKPEQIVKALHQAGIMADDQFFANLERMPGMFMKRYKDKPEFDPSLFSIA